MSAKRVFRCLWRCLCAVLCGVLVLLLAAQGYLAAARLIAKKSNPTIFGFQSAVVLTGSMSGAIEAGDLILVHAEKEYAAGDIILFKDHGGTRVTHRIVQKTPQGFVTKGDANDTEDAGAVLPEQILGKVVLVVPYLGRAVQFLKTPAGLLLLFICLLAVLFLSGIGHKKKEESSKQ